VSRKVLMNISITIPTQNSGKTLSSCLSSIFSQPVDNIEVIVVDGHSSDNTLDIANEFGCDVLFYSGSLLGKRCLGIDRCRGEFILLMDSDQVLAPRVLSRTADLLLKYDMLVLEEKSLRTDTAIQKLYSLDRILVHQVRDFSPFSSALLPRIFRANVLRRAILSIPQSLLAKVCAQDHAILYFESWKVSNKVGYVESALYHNEPTDLGTVFRKNLRYGRCDKILARSGYYDDLTKARTRIRKGITSVRDPRLIVGTLLLQTLKGVAYGCGYVTG